ncbi:lymphocyte antigen 75-like isoform X2 [Amphibalanus amphitrite]|nr:lymphocyte antigen 75-like [Amphibalanus amphitrite]XP_043230682.1 lymphocyte antigen 75-like isoform X2 [Amphibalanus amphitrite]
MYWADHSYGSQGWAWSDGSPLPAGDIHWYSGYPHLPASVVSRGLYERSSAALMNAEPNYYKYGVVCQAPLDPTTVQPSTTEPTTTKPDPTTPEPTPEPTTVEPRTTPQPTTEEPQTTPQPTTEEPQTTPQPTTEEPQTTLQPTTAEPQTTLQPTTEEPQTTLQPTTEEPQTTLQPTTEEPRTTPQPTTEEPQTTPQPTTEEPLPCPQGPGWLDVVTGDGSCYYLSSSDPDAGNFTWDGAAQACANQQASLASVPDLITFYALSFQVRGGGQNVWTGLISVPVVGYSWSDGSEFDEQLKQFIVPGNGTVGYLSADDGEFHLADADQSAAFVCRTAPAPAPTTTAPPPAEPCPAGWEQSEDTCYLFSEQQGYWTEAMSACHQEEADLLSIHDDMLITFLVLRVGNNTFWTGLQNQNTTYVWQDGSSTDDIDLVEPYLDPWQSGKDCVAMNTELYIPKQQFLIHDDCFAENRFVCQKPAN